MKPLHSYAAFITLTESVQPYSSVVMTAISNTPGIILYPDGSIQLSVSRYQKPEQSGELSVRTGVFYLPEIKSPYGKYYRNNSMGYGGKEYITGTIICKKPYIIRSGTGGLGPRKAYTELIGKDKYIELDSDIRKVYWKEGDEKVLAVRQLLDKYNGYEEGDNYDISYEMVRVSNVGNLLRMAIQENVIAHGLRDKGYDSVLSYSTSGGELRLSELYYLLQDYYPEESGFTLPE